MSKENEVPVTGPFLSFVAAFQAAKTMYLNEGLMANELGLVEPESWRDRCETLFMTTYAAQADAIGLSRNLITFKALLDLEVPAEALSMDYSELPKHFVFDPWLGMGRGGIKRLAMAKEIPCIFEVDSTTKEATGTVAPFCSEECRTKAEGTLGFAASIKGVSRVGDFGYTPHCEECGKEIA